MPYLSYPEAEAFYGGELDEDSIEAIRQAAASEVQIHAPEPTSASEAAGDDYTARALHTERMLGAWLAAGGAIYSGFGGVSSASATLKDQRAQDIIAQYMGLYFKGGSNVGWVFSGGPGE